MNGKLADLDLVARLLGLGLGQADAGDLRAAIGAAGNVAHVHRVRVRVLIAELLAIASAAITPSWLALCASHGGAVTSPIAQSPATLVRHIGSVSMWPGGLHAERLEPDILGVGSDADRDDGVAEAALGGLAVLGLDRRGDALGVGLEALDAGRREDLMPCFGRAPWSRRGDLGILDRHDAVEHLDHRHLGAHVVVEAGELDPDRARADHQQLGRHLRRRHRVAIGPDALAVGLGERQLARARAGGDDDVLADKLGRLAVAR